MLDVNIIPADMQASLMQADQEVFKSPSENDDLRAAAEKFEAIFLNEFMKQARKTKLAEDLFGSSAKTTYEEMLDREYADNLSDKVNLGIADALVRQLGGQVSKAWPTSLTLVNLACMHIVSLWPSRVKISPILILMGIKDARLVYRKFLLEPVASQASKTKLVLVCGLLISADLLMNSF